MYKITSYTFNKAKQLGVSIKPSTNKNKKIDVYKKGIKIVSIGDKRYDDFPSYIEKRGLQYAKERRRLYRIRHEKDRHIKGTAGYFSDKLLW